MKASGPVEVLDAQGRSLGEFGADGRPVAPNLRFTTEEGERKGAKRKGVSAEEKSAKEPESRASVGAKSEQVESQPGNRSGAPTSGPSAGDTEQSKIAAAEASKAAASGRREAEPSEFSDPTRAKLSPANEPVAPRGDAANDARRGASMSIDQNTMQRLAANRASQNREAADQLGLNGIERAGDPQVAAQPAPRRSSAPVPQPGGNRVESDEIFTATQSDSKPFVPPEVERRYLRVGDKFYNPKNTAEAAFEDKGNRLETRSNSEQIAETMVTIARARGWDEIRVTGSETFRREAWLEAAANGMSVRGYTPNEADKAELARKSAAMQAGNGVEKVPEPQRSQAAARAAAYRDLPPAEAAVAYPELAGAYAAEAAVGKRVDADALPPAQRKVVMERVRQNMVNAIERGDIPRVDLREERERDRDQRRPPEQEMRR